MKSLLMVKMKAVTLILLLHITASASTYIILDNASNFRILNRYEQSLSADEFKRFGSQTPCLVIEEDELLGDEITQALKFSFDGEVYYLQKGDNGRLVNKTGKAEGVLVLQNCRSMGDTIEVKKNGVLELSASLSGALKGKSMAEGDQFKRLFKYRDKVYLSSLRKAGLFGWVPQNKSSAWQQVKSQTINRPYQLTSVIKKQLTARLKSANKLYEQLFNSLQVISGKSAPLPVWQCKDSEQGLFCSLQGAKSYALQLESSNKMLARDLENILLGVPYVVNFSGSQLAVVPSSSSDRPVR